MDIMAGFTAAALLVNGVLSVTSLGTLAVIVGIKNKRPAQDRKTSRRGEARSAP